MGQDVYERGVGVSHGDFAGVEPTILPTGGGWCVSNIGS